MKTLRIAHGIGNTIVDVRVNDDFNLISFYRAVQHDGYFIDDQAKIVVNAQWIQHCILLTDAELQNMQQTQHPMPDARLN